MALREIEARLGVADRLAGCLKNARAPDRVVQSLAEIIRFRLLMIAAGYEDGNDATSLRHDPVAEAAAALGVTSHRTRRLIQTGVLAAEQVVPGAPWQIRAQDLAAEPVQAAVARKGRPCRTVDADTLPMFTDT